MGKLLASLMAAVLLVFCVSAYPARAAQRPLRATRKTIAVYASVLRKINPQLPNWQSDELARHLLVNAERWRLDANMLVAIVTVESRWHTHALSSAGAIGLGQLMPGTAARLGVNPHDPAQNLSGAARYLSGLMHRFGDRSNRDSLVFAAYNAGAKAVADYGGIPPFYETQHYVVRVLRAWHHLQKTVHVRNDPALHSADLAYWLDATAQ